MFRSCFCCPVAAAATRDGFAKTKTSSRDCSSPSCNRDTAVAQGQTTIKRKYTFHNSVVVRHKKNKNRKQILLNHTVFVVPAYIPPGTPTAIEDVESSVKISRMGAFSVTTVPETRQEPYKTEYLKRPPDNGQNKTQLSSPNGGGDDLLSATSNVSIEKSNGSAILESRRVVDLDDRPIRPGTIDIVKKALSQTSVNGFIKPPNVQLYSTTVGTLQLKNDCSKPIAEVKPTTSAAVAKLSNTESRRSIGTHLKKQEKRLETEPNFTPFNEPQKALQLVFIQINSPEWEAAVTGLQSISRLSMFHGKELRAGSLQPFARKVATHIKSLRSQVARAACTAAQKMFSYVPKSVEPDVEAIASALFPRTADTNKFLRIQSTEALNAMVDNVIPSKCVYVITSKGIKHGNRLVRAEACRLLARLVDKLGVSGTLHLPSDARDTVITAATSMVLDNTPTSRQAAQHILARLSEDPRGAELISSAVSPNIKATLNKSLSRIFLK